MKKLILIIAAVSLIGCGGGRGYSGSYGSYGGPPPNFDNVFGADNWRRNYWVPPIQGPAPGTPLNPIRIAPGYY
jgi:hypothetical protein